MHFLYTDLIQWLLSLSDTSADRSYRIAHAHNSSSSFSYLLAAELLGAGSVVSFAVIISFTSRPDSSLVGFSVVESPLVALSLALLALGYTVFLPTSAKRGTSASSVTVRSGGTWLKVLLFYTEAGDLWVLRFTVPLAFEDFIESSTNKSFTTLSCAVTFATWACAKTPSCQPPGFELVIVTVGPCINVSNNGCEQSKADYRAHAHCCCCPFRIWRKLPSYFRFMYTPPRRWLRVFTLVFSYTVWWL